MGFVPVMSKEINTWSRDVEKNKHVKHRARVHFWKSEAGFLKTAHARAG
jgi:hypothetical protein